MSRERQFEEALRQAYQRAGHEAGYWGNYFNRSLKQIGGLATARKMLAPRAPRATLHQGFQAIVDAGRIDLSMESVVLRPEFASLFTRAELAEARRRLAAFPSDARQTDVPPDQRFPDELLDPDRYVEGAKRKVTANAYERDPRARAACLKRHGRACTVCGVNHAKVYGKLGERCVHVHHLKPLAAARGSYRVDPVKDLVPVCPNCHAMLHSKNPPLWPDELKKMLADIARKR